MLTASFYITLNVFADFVHHTVAVALYFKSAFETNTTNDDKTTIAFTRMFL